MELIYGYTAPFCEFVRSLPEQDRRVVRDCVNQLGEEILQDYDAPLPQLFRPAQLLLRHDFTPTLSILPVTESVVVLLCYERDDVHSQIRISLLDAVAPEEAHGRFFVLAKMLYGQLLLGMA